jgi:transposase
MDGFLGLEGVDHFGTHETHWAVETAVIATGLPACRTCGPHDRMESKGLAPRRIRDTPARGKPSTLSVERRRYKCLLCGASVTQEGPATAKGPIKNGRKKVTGRLLLYIQNQVTKRPLSHVAKETGVPVATVRDIALELDDALAKHHRFKTPPVLGMDGLKINGTEYMVIGDADDGHLIAIVEPANTTAVRKWMKDYGFDVGAVDVFVTDMHSVNRSLARNELEGALHIADKWHILHNFQKILSRAVDVAVSDLRAGNDEKGVERNLDLAQALDDLKPAVMSVSHARLRKRRRHRKGDQQTIDFGSELKPILDKVDSVSRAYWARYDLIEMYQAITLADATHCRDRCIDRLIPLLDDKSLAPEVQSYIGHLTRNEKAIFNYFERIRIRPNGKVRGPTTNVLEQRNGMIRAIWRSGKGIPTLPLIRLRAIYGQWTLGLDIVQCAAAGCPTFHGPLIGPPVPLHMQHLGTGWRCQLHAI